MPDLSSGARRILLAAACVAGVFACGSLAVPAVAAPSVATGASTPESAAAAAAAQRIGALSERLFDAAVAAQWPSAQAALQSLHEQAVQLNGSFDDRFLAAGGNIDDLYAAHNALVGDLAEADIAARAMESVSLSQVANRITLTAGELAQPFAEAPGAPVALKVDAAMFQARRMLDALVWADQPGYESAHRKFSRLWLDLRESPGLDRAKADALDRALALAALSRNPEAVRQLQRAAQELVASFEPSPRPARHER